jgi:hypothetical protein
MSRNVILVLGAISWTAAAVVAILHLASGDLVVPAAMGFALVAWVTVRRNQLAQVPAEA